MTIAIIALNLEQTLKTLNYIKNCKKFKVDNYFLMSVFLRQVSLFFNVILSDMRNVSKKLQIYTNVKIVQNYILQQILNEDLFNSVYALSYYMKIY